MARRGAAKGRRRPRKPSPSSAAASDGGAATEDVRPKATTRRSAGGGFFCCYLLRSLCPRLKGRTYIGFTVNPWRRIRQHNGEISSGAWHTRRGRPWEMVLCIYGFPTNVAALQFEWAWQNPKLSLAVREVASGFKSLSGAGNKIKLAYAMLNLPSWEKLNLTLNFFSSTSTKFAAGCPPLPSQMKTVVCPMGDLQYNAESIREDQGPSSGEEDVSNNPQDHQEPRDFPRGGQHSEFAPTEWDGILDLTEPDRPRTSPQCSLSSDVDDDRIVQDEVGQASSVWKVYDTGLSSQNQGSTSEKNNVNNDPQDYQELPDTPRGGQHFDHSWKQQSIDQVQQMNVRTRIADYYVSEEDDSSNNFATMEWDGILDLTEPDGLRTSPQCSLSSDGDDDGVVEDEPAQMSPVWIVCAGSDGGGVGVVDDELGQASLTPMLKAGATSDCGDSGVTNDELGQVSQVDATSDEGERDLVVDLITPIERLRRRAGTGRISPRIIDLTSSPVVIEL